MSFQSLILKKRNFIAIVELNQPEKANSLGKKAWEEFKNVFELLDKDKEVRVIVLTAKGNHFCSGIDLQYFQEMLSERFTCESRKRESLHNTISFLQSSVNAIEKCSKPVIAAIHGACIGAGLDIVSACDFRYATIDAFFSIKEVDLGIVADLGSLQRLPKIVNDGVYRELAYTGRNVYSSEAKEIGLINNFYKDQETLLAEVEKIASVIASKSPITVRGIKKNILFSRDSTVEQGLNYVAAWNSAMLLSEDLKEIIVSQKEKRNPQFKD